MSTQDRCTTGERDVAFELRTAESRPDRLGRLFARHPESVACRRCGSPVRRSRRDRRVWEHVTTGLIRCTGTRGVTHAAPAGTLTSLDVKEVA